MKRQIDLSKRSAYPYTMSAAIPNPPEGFDELTVEEKIDYIQSLWDRIAATPDTVPVPEWHKRVLDERLAAHQADPLAGTPWEEARDAIERKLAK